MCSGPKTQTYQRKLSLHLYLALGQLSGRKFCVVFSLLPKNESRLMKSPVCLSVCPPLITSEPLGRFHEIWYGDNAIQGDLDAIIFNPIASIILKLLRFKVVRQALLNCGFGLFMFCGKHGNQVV
jgi:hypothetical protein